MPFSSLVPSCSASQLLDSIACRAFFIRLGIVYSAASMPLNIRPPYPTSSHACHSMQVKDIEAVAIAVLREDWTLSITHQDISGFPCAWYDHVHSRPDTNFGGVLLAIANRCREAPPRCVLSSVSDIAVCSEWMCLERCTHVSVLAEQLAGRSATCQQYTLWAARS